MRRQEKVSLVIFYLQNDTIEKYEIGYSPTAASLQLVVNGNSINYTWCYYLFAFFSCRFIF